MMSFKPDIPVYLHQQAIDFRKQINGLSMIVQESLLLDPFTANFFVLINRNRTRIKILYWDRNGFCLWMKRLEKHRFAWPTSIHEDTVTIHTRELQWLLEGFDIWKSPPHQALHYASV